MSNTSGFAFSHSDCGISDKIGTPALNRYCTKLHQKMINSDPGHGSIGKLEKATPFEGEAASQHYYWIVTKDGHTYFDGNSIIGRKILKVCSVDHLCAMNIGIEKSRKHDVGHAMFWITKIIGEPISE
jgi:hypothetical protein